MTVTLTPEQVDFLCGVLDLTACNFRSEAARPTNSAVEFHLNGEADKADAIRELLAKGDAY